MPRVEIANHHPEEDFDLDRLGAELRRAFPACLAAAKSGAALHELDEVEISLVDDAAIAEVHGRFMDDPTATDVITFDHGEILISLDTARRQASANSETMRREVLLYAIHGLLHLAGFDDLDAAAREEMEARQRVILDETCPTDHSAG